jgi:transcriptional regulator with XRE-family HTH domain
MSDADIEYIEMRLAARRYLKTIRQNHRMTQKVAAEKLRTSQSRLAKMEAGDASVSLDLLFKSLFFPGRLA